MPAVRRPGAQAEDVHRSRARADRAQPVANGGACDRLRRLRGREQGVAQRQARRERRGVRAARAVRRSVRVAPPRDRADALAVEEEVGRLLEMTAGDDHCARAQGMHGPRELLRVEHAVRVPGEDARLGDVRGDDGRAELLRLVQRGSGSLSTPCYRDG